MNGHVSIDKPLPWHAGEIAIQRSAGVEKTAADIGRRFIRDHLIEQHRLFYPQLPFLVVGAVDPEGDPWATVINGKPGFLSVPDEHTIHAAFRRDPSDPADRGFENGGAIGVLGIELHTRRRNRMNGNIANSAATGFDIEVVQSYGNCPRYIQLRDFHFARDPGLPFDGVVETLAALDDDARAMIRGADAFFVASYADVDGIRQADGSSRGGKPGFVRVDRQGVLTIPDFNGNTFFNTLGNILANGRAGLTFVDFATGDMLQMSGRAEVILESPDVQSFQGAERFWTFSPQTIVRRKAALAIRWTAREDGRSPYAEMTGDWEQVAERARAAALATQWRRFRIEHAVDESRTIRSLYLRPMDGAGVVAHKAGQHLPIRVRLHGEETRSIRTYTLSSAPSDGMYRISVKRDGKVSQFLHGLKEGAEIEARAPAGNFTVDPAEKRPAVMLAAGVGITPMIAMLRTIVFEGIRKQSIRKTWLFYSARSRTEQAFGDELDELAVASGGNLRIVRLLSDTTAAQSRTHFDVVGRIDLDLLRRTLPFDDYDFYLCGPSGFMQDIYAGLRSLDISDGRIFAEAFGPGSIQRTAGDKPADVPEPRPATVPVTVAFTESGKEAAWSPDSGTLLELAEANGLSPAFGCRSGSCGTCMTRVVEGAVAYAEKPSAPIADGHALICCARPAEHGDGVTIGLKLAL
ncbi:2Fe-2S iron-sulfur cluster-binding protein [Rhizobium sp.]